MSTPRETTAEGSGAIETPIMIPASEGGEAIQHTVHLTTETTCQDIFDRFGLDSIAYALMTSSWRSFIPTDVVFRGLAEGDTLYVVPRSVCPGCHPSLWMRLRRLRRCQ